MVQHRRRSRSSWAKSVRSSFGRTVMGKAIWENSIETWLGENSKLGMLVRTTWKGLFLSVYVDDIKSAGNEQNIDPMWKLLNKEVDLGEPTSFFDHENLGCTRRQCEISKDIVDNYRTMFESRISARATEKLSCSENLCISSWSYDMEGHAKKCVERYCELANKTTHQLYKVSTPCNDDHHFKEELNSVGQLCFQIVLIYFFLARNGRLCFYGQWTNLHDRSQNGPKLVTKNYLVWYLTFIIHVKILRIQNLHQVEHCSFLEVIRLFQSVGCVRNKLQFRTVQQNQKSFFGRKLDGIPALDLWDLIVAILYGNTNQINQAQVHELSSCSTSQTSNAK